MRSVGSRWVALVAFWPALPLACGGQSRTTPGDPEPGDAGKGSGGSSSVAGTKPMPSGGSSEPSAGGAAPAGGMESGGMASGGVAVGMAGSPGGMGGMPVFMCPSSGGAGAGNAAPETFAGTKNAFGFAFSSSFFLTPCVERQGSYHCKTLLDVCPNQDAALFEERGRVFHEEFELGGCTDTMYSVTFKVNGIVEGKYYEGGTRRRGEDFSNFHGSDGTDTWYVGGSPVESNWNVFKLTVLQPDGVTELQHYYLNSFPTVSGAESYATFAIAYEATVDMPGQGVVRFTSQDSNCDAIDNRGPGDNTARVVPNEPGLAVPATYGGKAVDEQFNVVNGANQPFHAQMVHVTITKVELKP